MYQSAIASVLSFNPGATIKEIGKILQVKKKAFKQFAQDFADAKSENQVAAALAGVQAGEFYFVEGDDSGDYMTFPLVKNGNDIGVWLNIDKDDHSWNFEVGDCYENRLLNPEELGLTLHNYDAGGSQYHSATNKVFDAGTALAEGLIIALQAKYAE